MLRLEPYVQQLRARRGLISEFVNPKYKDDSRTAFKSATRLECMMQVGPAVMCCSAACCLPRGVVAAVVWSLDCRAWRGMPQDYAKDLPESAKVGFTVINQVIAWRCQRLVQCMRSSLSR